MRKLFLIFSMCFALLGSAYAQQTVTGTVTGDDGSSLPGVSIVQQGTSNGTITDIDGKYSISVPSDATLLFSFVGMDKKEVSVDGRSVIDITLSTSAIGINEVVVTALGIKKEKKQITYAAQNVQVEELTKAREVNVVNSLAGKVAGLDMTKGSGGVGSATRVVLRGTRSIAGNNQPIYVIDGVPTASGTNGGPSSEYGGFPSFSSISGLNPDDIESITVLKGANAAAIYGSSAQNGAIVITTKSGKGKKGLGIEVSSNMSVETPLILTKFQQEY